MPLPLPRLDDLTYAELTARARAQIPTLYPAWTDHNPSDPGIAVLELLAWVAEQVGYQADQLPERSYDAFLRLLNGEGYVRDGPLDEAMAATVLRLREPQRAVSPADYEALALGAWNGSPEALALGEAGQVARARCLPGYDLSGAAPRAGVAGHVSLVVVPAVATGGLFAPTPELIAALWAWLDERRMLGTRHHVAGPTYVQVTLEAALAPRPGAEFPAVAQRAAENLAAHFHPLSGGPAGAGWPFGRAVHVSELYRVLDRAPGVDYVELRALKAGVGGRELPGDDAGTGGVRLEPYELPLVAAKAGWFNEPGQKKGGRP
ncbi:MAG TPA: baseplate J/gp47 family protein [Chloroflexaceae bacterium]|nr:baseplate J/gp47 family protein [Chloroflexaceae bacterium]